MNYPRPSRIALTASALLLSFAQAGCLTYLNAVPTPSHEDVAACKEVPKPCRSHVYVFLVHGMDPLDFANLNGVRDYLQTLGFIKTYYGQMYHIVYFKKEIRRLHEQDPEARFVLVGFSFGANLVRNLANDLRADKIPVDLLVYLGGNTLTNDLRDRPDNVVRIVNILATGWIWNGAALDDAENISYDNVWHFGSPTHPRTLELLGRELTEVAGRVPFVEMTYSSPGVAAGQLPAEPDEWDFLLPNHQVPALPPRPAPPATASRDHKPEEAPG